MKLVEVNGDSFLFELTSREKALLLDLCGHYPLIPAKYQKVTKDGKKDPNAGSSQTLLEEALAGQREQNRGRIKTFLNGGVKFNPVEGGYRLKLNRGDIDWLLEVLNDIRVGSWVLLGSPSTEDGSAPALSEENIPYLWTMEASGFFQMSFLHALRVN